MAAFLVTIKVTCRRIRHGSNAGGSLSLFLPLLIIPALFLIAISTMFKRRRPAAASTEIELCWSEMSLFERHGMNSGGRIESALHTGCEKLGLPNAIVSLQKGETSCVQNVASLDGSGDRFVVGQVLPRSLTFCGMLSGERAALAIEYAGLSEWLNHPSYRELGWESYIGVRRELSTGEGLVIAFYHQRPREILFSPEEKRLVGLLADWISAILERERGFAVEARADRSEPVARA